MPIYNFELMEQQRKKKAMELTELAYLVGVSEPHIRQILSGSSGCSEKTMWRIADVLKLRPEKLDTTHKK